jgi:hypothetical protein
LLSSELSTIVLSNLRIRLTVGVVLESPLSLQDLQVVHHLLDIDDLVLEFGCRSWKSSELTLSSNYRMSTELLTTELSNKSIMFPSPLTEGDRGSMDRLTLHDRSG